MMIEKTQHIVRHKNSKKSRFTACIFHFRKVKVYKRNHKKYRFLAISTPWNRGSFRTYIAFLTKLRKKGKPGEMDLPYLKTISQILNPLSRCWIHSRNQKFG